MTAVLAVVVGLILGVGLGVALLRRSAAIRAEGLFRAWRADEAATLTRTAVDDGRLAGKTSVTGGLAGGRMLPFLASDAHFVGHPVHLVVFDGDSEVKAGAIDELRAVVFVTVEQGLAAGAERDDADLVAECVAGGRVRWETIRHPG